MKCSLADAAAALQKDHPCLIRCCVTLMAVLFISVTLAGVGTLRPPDVTRGAALKTGQPFSNEQWFAPSTLDMGLDEAGKLFPAAGNYTNTTQEVDEFTEGECCEDAVLLSPSSREVGARFAKALTTPRPRTCCCFCQKPRWCACCSEQASKWALRHGCCT